jgi:hypothetical protein
MSGSLYDLIILNEPFTEGEASDWLERIGNDQENEGGVRTREASLD